MEQMIGISLAEYIQNKLKERELININDNFTLKDTNVNEDYQASNLKEEASRYNLKSNSNHTPLSFAIE
jgi:hypothetical protein